MTKAQYKKFLSSPEWQEVRKQCLIRSKQGDNRIVIGKCECCGYIPWKSSSLQLHHKTYTIPGKTLKEVLLDAKNIEVLCVNCHKGRHKRE